MTEVTDKSNDERPGASLEWLVWVLAAAGLRFLFLERWSLWGDEAYSLIDARNLDAGEWRDSLKAYPLFFALELLAMKLFGTIASVEWTLRLVPALAGSLAVGVCFEGSRTLLPRIERRFLAALVLFCPWLVFHSQYARFYSLLLLLTAYAGLGFLRAVKNDCPATMARVTIALLLAVLVHPTAMLLLIAMLAVYCLQRVLGLTIRARVMRPLLIVSALFAIGAALRHETVANTVAYKILARDVGADSVIDLVQGLAYNLGLSIALMSVLGLVPLWQRDRGLGSAVVAMTGLTSGVMVALAVYGTSIEQRYMIPIVPLILLAAAALLGRLVQALRGKVPFATAIVAALALIPYAPNLVSHYIDGNRHDLREAAVFLAERVNGEATVVAENHYLMGHYLPDLPEEQIHEAPPTFKNGLRRFRDGIVQHPVVWVVVPDHFLDLGGDREEFFRWAMNEGRLERELYRPRLDYHQNRLKVFRVDARTARRYVPAETSD